MNAEDLQEILRKHKLFLSGESEGERANLSGAYLRGANLSGANLSGAYLRGANEIDNVTLPNGVKFEDYLRELVPALCTAGGVALEQVAASWDCHDWSNCPMHAAFGVDFIDKVPPLYRAEAALFVQLFDARLIPNPLEKQIT